MENRKFLKAKPLLIVTAAVFALLLIIGLLAKQQWLLFYSTPVKGSVIDAGTNKPIEGAVVVGMWALTEVPGQGSCGYAKVSVATTDKEGKFKIPFWMTFKPWKLKCLSYGLGSKIVIYKPGYQVFWSYEAARKGNPSDYQMTKEERKKLIEESSINPAKLKRVYTDEEIWENHKEFRSQTRSYKYFSKKQRKEVLNNIKEIALQLSSENSKVKDKLLKDVKEDEDWNNDRREK